MNNQLNGHRRGGAIPYLPPSNYEAEDDKTYKQMRYLSLSHGCNGLIQTHKQIIAAGDLGTHSTYSVINPGVLYREQSFQLLCRGEPEETVWFGDFLVHQASPLWCTLDDDLNIKDSFLLSYSDIPLNSRPEDWRLFEYEEKLYTNHSVYIMIDREQWIVHSRPGISEIDLENRTLTLRWMLEPPFKPSSEEKNWSFFVHNGTLMCIYSFNPYIILEVDLATGRTYKLLETYPNYQWYDKGKFVGNSTNLVSWDDDHYIMFVHDFLEPKHEQRNRAYMQYGTLINKQTLLPTSVIPRPLMMGGDEPGRHPGVHYTSALVNREDGLYGFYGQGDTHTGIVVFNKAHLQELFAQYRLDKGKHSPFGTMKGIDARKGIILSYPASGFNWVRYCIEHFTGLRTAGKTKLVKEGELAVYRSHYVKYSEGPDSCFCPFYDDQGKPLHHKVVLILRDYRESFLRAAKGKNITNLKAEKIRNGDVFDFHEYFENLKAFDQFSGQKLLVYYPELVSDMSGVTKILDFLELPYDLSTFDLDYHRQKSIGIYDTQHKSHTQNNLYDFKFHQNDGDPEVIKAVEDYFTNKYGDLIKRYLS